MGKFFQIFGGSIFGLVLLFSAILLNQWFGSGPRGQYDDDYGYRDKSSAHSEGAARFLEGQGAHISRDDYGEPAEIYLPEIITDSDLEAVAELRSLRSVEFADPRGITDWGVQHLASLRGLHYLRLSGADITDDCIDDLIRLQALRELSIEDTGISFEGVERLEYELPDCSVNWNPRGDDDDYDYDRKR